LPIFDCKGIKAKCRTSLKQVDIRHALFLFSVLLRNGYRQIRRQHARIWVGSSTCNLSVVVYVFRACEHCRIAGCFEIV